MIMTELIQRHLNLITLKCDSKGVQQKCSHGQPHRLFFLQPLHFTR